MLETTIAIPCYNEEHRFSAVAFGEFLRQNREVGLLLVNDGSDDQTGAVIDAFASSFSRQVKTLHLKKNSGKAEAVRQAMVLAMQSEARYCGYWDADLATPLESIPEFVNVLSTHSQINLVIGTRLQLLGRQIKRVPIRQWLGKRFAQVASAVIGFPVQDTQCGAKLFRNNPITRALFSEPFTSRWIFDVELMLRMTHLRDAHKENTVRNQIYENPLDFWEDVAGSKLKKKDFLKAFYELGSLCWKYRISSARFTPDIVDAQLLIPLVQNQENQERKVA